MNAAKLKGLYCKACDDETAFILNDVDDRWPWRVQCRKCGVTGKSLTAEGAVQGWIYAEGNEDPKRHLMPDPIVDGPRDFPHDPKGKPLTETLFPEHRNHEAGRSPARFSVDDKIGEQNDKLNALNAYTIEHVERSNARLEALEENVRKLISKRTPKRFRSPGEVGNLMYPICETCRHLIKEDGCRCEV